MVGAGLGGSAVAYFLQQHFGPQVQLDVYEAAGVGGRLATVTVNKQQYESRGASIHALSLHMQDFVKILGEHGHPQRLRGLPPCAVGLHLGDVGRAASSLPRHPGRALTCLLSLLPSPVVPWKRKGHGGPAEHQGEGSWCH